MTTKTKTNMAGNEDLSWRTPAFRQSVVAKIDEAIQRSGMPTQRNSMEMENHVFQKANTKEEYLGFVARLILHVREMNSKKAAMGGAGPGAGPPGPGMANLPGMPPDPINALQTLARQGTANPHMVLGGPQGPGPAGMGPQQPGGQQMMMGLMHPGVPQPGQQGGPPGMMQQQPPQGPPMTASGLLQSMGQRPGLQAMPNKMGMGMPMPGMGGFPGQNPQMTPMQQQMVMQQQQQQAAAVAAAQRKQAESAAMGMVPVGPMGVQYGPRPGAAGTPTQQFLGQSPNNPGSVPSPAGPMGGGMPGSSQMAASPAQMVASPSPQLAGPPGSVGQQRSIGMAPSPSSSLNTPGLGAATPSPCSLQEEQAYRDKVRQLSKYIEPLQRMIARMGSEDVEKHSKMKKLLEILSNPSKRMPLETLLKCEVVLEKLDFRRGDGGSIPPPPAHLNMLKEHHVYNPVLEVLANQLHSPVINHTLQRTFGPTLEALLGPEIKMVPSSVKRQKAQDSSDDIPEVLQGEIARLDQRFKVSLNPTQHPGSRSVHLICWLDDKHLPCVPPICITVPDDYPASPPKCDLAAHEYGSTAFLSAVQKALSSRIHKLPSRYSVSQVLDTWEMAVRQAASPSQQAAQLSATAVLLGF